MRTLDRRSLARHFICLAAATFAFCSAQQRRDLPSLKSKITFQQQKIHLLAQRVVEIVAVPKLKSYTIRQSRYSHSQQTGKALQNKSILMEWEAALPKRRQSRKQDKTHCTEDDRHNCHFDGRFKRKRRKSTAREIGTAYNKTLRLVSVFIMRAISQTIKPRELIPCAERSAQNQYIASLARLSILALLRNRRTDRYFQTKGKRHRDKQT